MTRKERARMKMVYVRLPQEIVDKADEEAEALSAKGGEYVSRSTVLRSKLIRGFGMK